MEDDWGQNGLKAQAKNVVRAGCTYQGEASVWCKNVSFLSLIWSGSVSSWAKGHVSLLQGSYGFLKVASPQ